MKWFYALIALLITMGCQMPRPAAQSYSNEIPHPKLIIGITIDQMRYDFIDKYWSDFSDNGFRLLVNEGFFCRNLQYNYMPTYTGPGHASIFTGTTPAYHGIIANDWYRKAEGDSMYCARDLSVTGVGTISSAGQMSPVNLMSSTIGDELKVFFNERSKVIGIAMKDRGAILPAGRRADAAYWFVGKSEGVWASSSWYMNSLPDWVNSFNNQGKADEYLKRGWDLLLKEKEYDESMADNNPYEAPFKGLIRPVFPYNLDTLRTLNGNYELIKATPWGNTLTVDFALSAIENEHLGEDDITDMLCVSFSATDYVGHQFGIHSRELQDCYLRLDKDLEAFIAYLDKKIGRDNYLIFLSADHGGAPTPSYVKTMNDGASYFKPDPMVAAVDSMLDTKFGDAMWVMNYSNDQFFLNWNALPDASGKKELIEEAVADFCLGYEGVYKTYAAHDMDEGTDHEPIADAVQLGYNQKLSGDVMVVTNPGWMEYGLQGTTHGSPFVYDTHVPAIFFGYLIPNGYTFDPHSICDIAPTVSALSRIPFTNSNIGIPVKQIVESDE